MQGTYQFGRLSRLHVFGWICFLKGDDSSLFQNLEVWVANCLWMQEKGYMQHGRHSLQAPQSPETNYAISIKCNCNLHEQSIMPILPILIKLPKQYQKIVTRSVKCGKEILA